MVAPLREQLQELNTGRKTLLQLILQIVDNLIIIDDNLKRQIKN